MQNVCVIGLGYVGLTLAVTLAEKGFTVWGFDANAEKVAALQAGRAPFFEPGVPEALAAHQGVNLFLSATYEKRAYDVILLAVSTPVDPATHRPNLGHLDAAVRTIAENLEGDPLVIVRSTVPVGTTECRVAPVLRAAQPNLSVAFAPERTIQGQALRELVELPQVVGGVDERSLRRAVQFFERVAQTITPVSTTRAAEMVKLINNCHTDLIYSFGNEVALLAEAMQVDPLEAIQAANLNYPRPKIHRPGFVAGACLTKDPYLLLASTPEAQPFLILGARRLNEHLPAYTAQRVRNGLLQQGVAPVKATVVVCGIAYKGTPPTDDLRGTQSIEVIASLRAVGTAVYGHDPLVPADQIQALGAEPLAALEDAPPAHAFVFLTDHAAYQSLDLNVLLGRIRRPGVLFDAWRIFPQAAVEAAGVAYQSIGL